MRNNIQQLKNRALKEIEDSSDLETLRNIEIKYLGRKGELTKILRSIKDLPKKKRPLVGQLANEVRRELEKILRIKKQGLEIEKFKDLAQEEWIDVTSRVEGLKSGHLHPNSTLQYELEDIFVSMGFMVLDGPELESDYYNFEALNIPYWHPARDIQDTFYVKSEILNPKSETNSKSQIPKFKTKISILRSSATAKDGQNQKSQVSDLLLRTQTSSVQVRALEKYGVPLRAIVPGRCFRNEATDASHEHTFYQLEGLMVDKDISIANLVSVMKALLEGIFKKEVKIRLRPGYFPFVEPGFELDISCLICGGKGCSVCKGSGWVELLPCGLVHPNVLKYGGVDPKKFSGLAFGLGLTRLVMMKYGIDDIRLFQSGDLRFLEQF
ncbi:MAG: phenylalanine--tRNA ligase subunit alpha [Parcubacteria group bacterium CG23_combo_of_CG06-09_8_20_14_all_35_9]|nr:MAG: phenylalanine--tRNA ligase subunit alpha [Parcubacteria group bacterium CG23_combo_of_CG06-09_8_20_14_all_35_9]